MIRRPTFGDVALALAAAILLGIFSFGLVAYSPHGSGLATLIVWLAVAVMHVALLWRTTHPVASAVAVYLGAFAHFVAGEVAVPSDLLIFVSLYSVTVHGSARARYWGLGGALFGAFLQGAGIYIGQNGLLNPVSWQALAAALMVTFFLAGALLAVWAFGLLRRTRIERVESLTERAHRLERERDQQAMIATAAERARIAREMHDVVAHSLSIIIAQADGGRYAAANNPQVATDTLTTIADTGRAALTDMRRILGVLRGDDTPNELLPQPDSGDLSHLIEQVRGTGLHVDFTILGQPQPLPRGMGLTTYRITQEALTNVLKHAGPAAVAIVTQQWHAEAMELTIDDDGRGASASSDGLGQGLLGMRERAAMVGGTFVAGPRPGGGYRVRVHIPLGSAPPPQPAAPQQNPFAPSSPSKNR